jgi:hypothetical protein
MRVLQQRVVTASTRKLAGAIASAWLAANVQPMAARCS